MTEEKVVARYPINFDELAKGTTIPPEKLKKVLRCEPGSQEYTLKAMSLCKMICEQLERRGLLVSVVIRKTSIRILTDEEATVYCYEQMQSYLKRSLRKYDELASVDTGQLDDDSKKDHERRLIVGGKQVQALAGAKSGLRVSHYVRNVPGLPAAE